MRGVSLVVIGCWLGWAVGRAWGSPGLTSADRISIAELREAVVRRGRTVESFRIEGLVRAVVRERRLVALQDDSGAVLLELPAVDGSVCVGEWLAVSGENCALTRSPFGVQVGTAAVVNNDGDHPALAKRGSVYLAAGLQPIRLNWFNGDGASALAVEYEGPGIQWQPLPDEVLWHKPAEATSQADLERGLEYAAYVGEGWDVLPDFRRMEPVAQGVAWNFARSYSTREKNAGLSFNGFLEISSAGLYTFQLISDDGGNLYVGEPAVASRVAVLERTTALPVGSLEKALAGPDGQQWISWEGVVNFAGPVEDGLELELTGLGNRTSVRVVDAGDLRGVNLLRRTLRVKGICEVSHALEPRGIVRVIVPSSGQVAVLDNAKETLDKADNELTTAEQIRRLKSNEARGRRARVRGAVVWASPSALVLQDATGGVYVHLLSRDWADQPAVGGLWEIEGPTDPGDFSPVIKAVRGTYLGAAAPPEPIRPTWDQLMNGSLDAEYVEIRGVLTALSEEEMTLLTQAGKIKVRRNHDHPLPQLPRNGPEDPCLDRPGTDWLDSVLRIRGCLTAEWDKDTRLVHGGEIFLSPAVVTVEESRPQDPFSIPTRMISDIFRFDSGAGALQRTKIAGQIIYARPGVYYLLDGEAGLRFLPKRPVSLATGDLVEAVGFPHLGGPSPVLYEAQIHKTGDAPLPAPVTVPAADLLNRKHDATLVQVEATLIKDTVNPGERILELQAGAHRFLARLEGESDSQPLTPGSRLQLTGVHAGAHGDYAGDNLESFELLLNNTAAITVLQTGPWWTLARALVVVAALGGGLGLAMIWITSLRRQVDERTTELQKQIEKRQLAEQRRAMEAERTRVAQDLHDELGAGLTEVGILGSLAKNPAVPPERKGEYLDQLTEAARALVTGLDEIVWAVNPHYDSVASLANYYSLFAQRFLDLAGVACRLQVPPDFPDCPLDSKLRHGIFLALKEALNNVVRHAGASEVQLRIEMDGDVLMVSVADDGCGFDAAGEVPGKDGLAGMRDRLRKLGGDCRIESHPGEGTTVEFRLRLEGVYHDQSSHR